jgi:hypothetical protein
VSSLGARAWRARRGIIVIATATTLLAIGTAIVARPLLSRYIERQLVTRVEHHFNSTLEVDTFHVRVFPWIHVDGAGLRLRLRGRQDAPPLITIGTFGLTGSLWSLAQGRVNRLDLDEVVIHIPPDGDRSDDPAAEQPAGPETSPPGVADGLVIDEIVSTRARLEIAPDDADGTPLLFDITHVRMEHFSLDGPAAYEARLMNPRPRGEIVSRGHFGPWQADHPRLTALSGDYTLTDADMSVFGGIAGTLDSKGRFEGILEAIGVTGTTSMPDFTVETGGHPMPLDTTFDARVDGTNGNTYLDRVSARLADSPLEASGEIAGAPDTEGKTIRLDVVSDAARLEDLIHLVVSQPEPPMLGHLELRAALVLPPGDRPVPDKLSLDGEFTIRRGQFASDAVQDKVDELSRRGQGQPKDESIANVLSDFSGHFTLGDGRLRLPNLRFRVRGAEVRLAGSYALRGERLDFEGELRLEARLSQTVTGFKSFLLKVIDPFFRKRGAGAVLPIKVEGTVSEPTFGVDMLRAMTPKGRVSEQIVRARRAGRGGPAAGRPRRGWRSSGRRGPSAARR